MKTMNNLSQVLKLSENSLLDYNHLISNSSVLYKTKLKFLRIGIIDTGVNKSHPCFANSKLITKDFTGGSNSNDELGHGTHCSAILIGNESNRHLGLIPDAKLYSAKVVGRFRKGSKHTEQAITHALKWLTKNKVHIILITMGRKNHSKIIENEINSAISQGIIIIASAGNHGGSLPLFPSSIPKVICVSALGKNGEPLPECYNGSLVDVFTPGESIISANGNSKYSKMSGSSQAAAIFCGFLSKKLMRQLISQSTINKSA